MHFTIHFFKKQLFKNSFCEFLVINVFLTTFLILNSLKLYFNQLLNTFVLQNYLVNKNLIGFLYIFFYFLGAQEQINIKIETVNTK